MPRSHSCLVTAQTQTPAVWLQRVCHFSDPSFVGVLSGIFNAHASIDFVCEERGTLFLKTTVLKTQTGFSCPKRLKPTSFRGPGKNKGCGRLPRGSLTPTEQVPSTGPAWLQAKPGLETKGGHTETGARSSTRAGPQLPKGRRLSSDLRGQSRSSSPGLHSKRGSSGSLQSQPEAATPGFASPWATRHGP